jgi:CPA2 family monovalent cation:H+ antiporter-2
VLVICIGVAYAVSSSGVSLALGAFLAGLVVAGSEYRHQAISDLLPFKDVFTSLFFVSVGMFIDPSQLLENAGPIAAILVAILVGKSFIMFIVAVIVRMPLRVAVLSAVALAQVGEFSFILFRAAQGTTLYVEPLMSNLLAAAILSMFLTPFAIAIGPHLAAGATRLQSLERRLGVKTAEDASETGYKLRDHVIIGGYGFAGRNLASALRECGVPYIIADLNSVNVREARETGEPAYFADITSSKVLQLLGAEHARQFVIVINDPNATFLAIRAAKRAAPNLSVLARITYIQDRDAAMAAGADEVVPAEQEAAVEVARRVLVTCKPEIAEQPEQLEELRKTVELSEDEG